MKPYPMNVLGQVMCVGMRGRLLDMSSVRTGEKKPSYRDRMNLEPFFAAPLFTRSREEWVSRGDEGIATGCSSLKRNLT
jgi:hypothetical protein